MVVVTSYHHMAVRCHVDVSLNQLPDHLWRHLPCCPRIKWLDQLWDTPLIHLEYIEEFCSLWSPWWSDATALAGHATDDDFVTAISRYGLGSELRVLAAYYFHCCLLSVERL